MDKEGRGASKKMLLTGAVLPGERMSAAKSVLPVATMVMGPGVRRLVVGE